MAYSLSWCLSVNPPLAAGDCFGKRRLTMSSKPKAAPFVGKKSLFGMNTLVTEIRLTKAQDIKFTKDEMAVELIDGRTIVVPLVWYPRIYNGTEPERNNWRLIGNGEGIHWPDLDEDIRVEHLLAGIPSGESQSSLQKWLQMRTQMSTKT